MWITIAGVHLVDSAVLGAYQRRQLRKQHLADGHEIPLSLEHASELGEVSLQPVLFGVLIRRRTQVLDHGVDVVFELRHLAARIDLNRTREVTLGDGGGDIRDSAYLGG